MNTAKTDWNEVFNYKEVAIYLSFTDIIELSTCSFKLRSILYGEKLKPFQVREYLKKEDYRTFEVEVEGKGYTYDNPFQLPREIIQASVNQFEIELQTLNPTVETLIIYDQYDYLYCYKIADRFVNITTLNLNLCKITIEMFQYMLNNLKLTELSINSSVVIGDITYRNKILMPQSLKKIKYNDFKYIRFLNPEPGPLSIKYRNVNSFSGEICLDEIDTETIQTLYYRVGNFSGLAKFFTMNPKLKSLTLRQHELFPGEVSTLIKNNQLEHLDSEYIINPPPENDPYIFESLKSLNTMIRSDIDSAFNIAKYCPNLTRLTTYIYSIQTINNSINYASQLKHLKYYALKSYKNQIFNEVINFPVMNELTELELTNFNPENLDWSQLSLFPKLKMIKFNVYYVKRNSESFVSEIQNSKTWKLVAIGDSRIYHKL